MKTHFSGAGDLPTHMTLIWADSETRIGVRVVCLGGDLKALCGGVWASGEKSGHLSFNICFSLVGSCYGDIDQPALPAPSVPECSTPVAKKAPRQGDTGRPHLQRSCHWWSPGLGGGNTRGHRQYLSPTALLSTSDWGSKAVDWKQRLETATDEETGPEKGSLPSSAPLERISAEHAVSSRSPVSGGSCFSSLHSGCHIHFAASGLI